jgi:hypothetical protein
MSSTDTAAQLPTDADLEDTCPECLETLDDCGCERCDECGLTLEGECECDCETCGDRINECACL